MILPIECLGWGWWGGVCMYDSSNRVFGVGCACMIHPIECLGWVGGGVFVYDSSNSVWWGRWVCICAYVIHPIVCVYQFVR